MRRGDIYWGEFDPARGREIRKTRPAIIISNTNANYRLNRLQVIPITSNIARVYAGETIIMVAGNPGKAVTDQIRTVAKERLGNRMGHISIQDMRLVEAALKTQLGLN